MLQKQGLVLSPPSRQTASPKTGKNRPRQEVLLREVLLEQGLSTNPRIVRPWCSKPRPGTSHSYWLKRVRLS
jgi:hypothetical protein